MIELVHKKKCEDAICGSPSRQLSRYKSMVTCLDCLEIIRSRGRIPYKYVVHAKVISVKSKPKEVDAERKIEQTIFNSHERMDIQAGRFFKGLCLGYDKPSDCYQ